MSEADPCPDFRNNLIGVHLPNRQLILTRAVNLITVPALFDILIIPTLSTHWIHRESHCTGP